jgi:hypothetical protein
MQLTTIDENKAKLTLDKQALPVIMACIRACFLELEGDFELRIGCPKRDVIKLADALQGLLDKAGITY